jgi:hypothetical protein
MQRLQNLLVLFAVSLFSILPASAQSCSQMSLGRGASLGGFIPFPADNAWNQDISTAAVDPNSANIINFIGTTTPLHPDFGAGLYAGQTIGIPYDVVSGSPFVSIKYTAYGTESDPGPMPIPANAPIEGYPKPGNGDRHVLVLDRDNCWLYEMYGSYPQKNATWNAGSGAVWDLLNDEQRPYTWTSSDAAGLSVFAGLARYDEVASGAIQHALRFTLQNSEEAFTPPASHWAGNSTNTYAAPMGMRMRLKSSFDISSYPPQAQVVLAALQKYGMIMADNGSSMYISGDPDNRWNNNDLGTLKQVPASAFDVIHSGKCSDRAVADDYQLYSESDNGDSRPASYAELECFRRIVFCGFAASGRDPRQFGDCDSDGDHDLHFVRDQRVWEVIGESDRNGELRRCRLIASSGAKFALAEK